MNEIKHPAPILEGIKEDLDSQVNQFMSMNDKFDWLLRLLENDFYEEACLDQRCREEAPPALLNQLDHYKKEIGWQLDAFERHLIRLEQAIKIPRKTEVKSPQ